MNNVSCTATNLTSHQETRASASQHTVQHAANQPLIAEKEVKQGEMEAIYNKVDGLCSIIHTMAERVEQLSSLS